MTKKLEKILVKESMATALFYCIFGMCVKNHEGKKLYVWSVKEIL